MKSILTALLILLTCAARAQQPRNHDRMVKFQYGHIEGKKFKPYSSEVYYCWQSKQYLHSKTGDTIMRTTVLPLALTPSKKK